MFELCTYTHQIYISQSKIQKIPLTKNVISSKDRLEKYLSTEILDFENIFYLGYYIQM